MQDHQLLLISPPYRQTQPVTPDEVPGTRVADGSALIWVMGSRADPRFAAGVANRVGGLTLLVMLPPAEALAQPDAALEMLECGRPHSVLPFHPIHRLDEWVTLLRRMPPRLAADFTDFLEWRGTRLERGEVRLIREIFERSREVRTVSRLAKKLYISRRALGRRFHKAGLPAPSTWLQFARALRVCIRLHCTDQSVAQVARREGYPDGFSFSNQLDRLVGIRPSSARDRLGWEWIAEKWIERTWPTANREVHEPAAAAAPHE